MPDNTREVAVSEPTKREVRQRCGFGCVLCGLPIYDYDHMRGYTLATADVPEEITLLCPQHHAEKTRGRLPTEKVIQANDEPANVKAGISTPYGLHYHGPAYNINIGQCNFYGYGDKLVALLMRDEEIISFCVSEVGELYLTANLRDRAGDLILSIIENEVIYSTGAWDVEFVGQTLTVRQALGDILFELAFHPPSRIDLVRANLAYENVSVFVDSTGFHVRGPGPRERDIGSFSTSGVRYAMTLDCLNPPPGVGLAL